MKEIIKIARKLKTDTVTDADRLKYANLLQSYMDSTGKSVDEVAHECKEFIDIQDTISILKLRNELMNVQVKESKLSAEIQSLKAVL